MPPTADPSKKKQQEDDTEVELTQAQIDAINAAVSGQVKRALKDVVTKSDLDTLSGSLVEKVVAAIKPAEGEKKPKEPKAGEEDPRLTAALERVAKLENAGKDWEKKAKDEARERVLDQGRSSIHRQLFVDGVPINDKGAKLKAKGDFADLLTDAFGRKLKVSDDGKVVMTIRRAPVKGMPEEDVDVSVDEGLQHWIKSDAARAYLPAPQTGGRKVETRPPQGRPPTAKKPTEDEPAEESLDSMLESAHEQLTSMGVRF